MIVSLFIMIMSIVVIMAVLMVVTFFIVIMSDVLAVVVMAFVVMVMVVEEGFLVQPALDVRRLGLRVVETGAEEARRLDLPVDDAEAVGAGVDGVQALVQRGDGLRLGDIRLGDQQPIGDGGLAQALVVRVQRLAAGGGVDGARRQRRASVDGSLGAAVWARRRSNGARGGPSQGRP